MVIRWAVTLLVCMLPLGCAKQRAATAVIPELWDENINFGDPDSYEAVALAEFYYDSGNFEAAAEHFLLAARTDSDDSFLYVRYASALSAMNRHKDAAKVLRAVIENEPDNDKAWLELADLSLRQGHSEKAEKQARRALWAEPGSTKAMLWLGDFYYDLQDFHTAQNFYQKAVIFEPSNAKAHLGIAESSLRLDATEVALSHYDSYASLWPHSVEMLIDRAGELSQAGRPKIAAELLSVALLRQSNDGIHRKTLIKLLYDLGELERAGAHLRQLPPLNPDDRAEAHWRACYFTAVGQNLIAEHLLGPFVTDAKEDLDTMHMRSHIRKYASASSGGAARLPGGCEKFIQRP